MRKYVFALILLGLISLTTVFGYGDNGPLYVTYYEKYNITGNTTGDGSVNVNINNITGYLTINNTGKTANDTLFDVWVAINISNNKSGLIVENPYGLNYSIYTSYNSDWGYTGLPNNSNTYIQIPTLPNGTYIIFKIALNESAIGNPLIVTESYSSTKIPARKNADWLVTINISRNASVTDNTILVSMTKYLSNSPSDYGDTNWTLLNITSYENSTGSVTLWDGPYFTGTANDSLNWTGVILNDSQNASIKINITGKYDYANKSALLAKYGFAVIFFKFNGTASGTHLDGVYATGMGGVSAYKQGPEQDTSGKYVVWYEQANVSNKADNYYFNLTKVKIWAVNGSNPATLDPFDSTLLIAGSEHILTPNEILSPRETWNTLKYNFTFEGVPVIWANCSFRVVDSNITLLNESINEYSDEYGSSYIVVERIYVIGSYLVKVTKHIISNGTNTYDIYVVVENIGGEKTPDYVYVYDLIPNNFNISDIWVENESMLAARYNGVENFTGNNTVSNPRYKACYYWALHEIYPGADGDGWYNSTEISNNQTVVIHYTLNGTGTFYPSDAFIVGIDPTNSLLPTTSPKITTVSGAIGNNFEPLLTLITALIGVGIVLRRAM